MSNPTTHSVAPANAGSPNPDPWEDAYLRFETPEQEIRKFVRRAQACGAADWPRDAHIVDFLSGRGNGLRALEQLGFTHLEGIDLSPRLAGQYQGPATMHVGDCRSLPFPDASMDVAVVQGGLHHLPELPSDLDRTLREAHRVLKPDGIFVAIEPWMTPFLAAVHALCHTPLRHMWGKLDALATMIEHEQRTYKQWLGRPDEVRGLLLKYFEPQRLECSRGKIQFVGKRRARRGISGRLTFQQHLPG